MSTRPTPAERTRATSPALPAARQPTLQPLVSPIGVLLVVTSMVFVLAGIIWPQAADGLLRLLFVTLAIGYVAAQAFGTVLPMRTTEDLRSPFDWQATASTPPATPQRLRKLSTELEVANDAQAAERTGIPLSVRGAVRNEVLRRLAEHHGLRLTDPIQHARIRSLVSESTWLLIWPHDTEARTGTSPTPAGRSVPLSKLGFILDDLERL